MKPTYKQTFFKLRSVREERLKKVRVMDETYGSAQIELRKKLEEWRLSKNRKPSKPASRLPVGKAVSFLGPAIAVPKKQPLETKKIEKPMLRSRQIVDVTKPIATKPKSQPKSPAKEIQTRVKKPIKNKENTVKPVTNPIINKSFVKEIPNISMKSASNNVEYITPNKKLSFSSFSGQLDIKNMEEDVFEQRGLSRKLDQSEEFPVVSSCNNSMDMDVDDDMFVDESENVVLEPVKQYFPIGNIKNNPFEYFLRNNFEVLVINRGHLLLSTKLSTPFMDLSSVNDAIFAAKSGNEIVARMLFQIIACSSNLPFDKRSKNIEFLQDAPYKESTNSSRICSYVNSGKVYFKFKKVPDACKMNFWTTWASYEEKWGNVCNVIRFFEQAELLAQNTKELNKLHSELEKFTIRSSRVAKPIKDSTDFPSSNLSPSIRKTPYASCSSKIPSPLSVRKHIGISLPNAVKTLGNRTPSAGIQFAKTSNVSNIISPFVLTSQTSPSKIPSPIFKKTPISNSSGSTPTGSPALGSKFLQYRTPTKTFDEDTPSPPKSRFFDCNFEDEDEIEKIKKKYNFTTKLTKREPKLSLGAPLRVATPFAKSKTATICEVADLIEGLSVTKLEDDIEKINEMMNPQAFKKQVTDKKKKLGVRFGLASDEPSGTVTVWTPVRAKKKERDALGVSSVVTPVRRSARLYNEDDYVTNEEEEENVESKENEDDQARLAKLLEQNGYAYMPNKSLNVEVKRTGMTPKPNVTKTPSHVKALKSTVNVKTPISILKTPKIYEKTPRASKMNVQMSLEDSDDEKIDNNDTPKPLHRRRL